MSAQMRGGSFSVERIVGVVSGAEAATLGLLKAVDHTVDAMFGIEKVMREFASILIPATEYINNTEIAPGVYVDADDKAINLAAGLSDSLKNFLAVLVRKNAAVDKDGRLKDHHCEALHEAYEQAAGSVAELVEIVDELRRAMIRHDLAAEPRDLDKCGTVDELIASLHDDP